MSDTIDLDIVEIREEGEEPSRVNPYAGMIIEDEAVVEEILNYLEAEMSRVEAAQEEEDRERWRKFRRQLEAQPEQKDRSGPIKNPSNVVPPLAQIHGQTMYAQINSYFAAREPFWTAEPLRADPEDRKDSKLWTKYLGLLSKSANDLDLGKRQRAVAAETSVMPLCLVKVPWTTTSWNFKTEGENGEVRPVQTTYRDGPELVVIPREDALFPPEWYDVHTMPWIAHVLHLPEHVVQAREATGVYRNVEQVLASVREESTGTEKNADEAAGKRIERSGIIDLHEVHFYWDVDKDGQAEDLIFVVHRPSRTVLRMRYNELGIRQFVDFSLIQRTFSIEGRATGQICERLQDEAEGIHNLRNDNMKVVSMRMVAMRRQVLLANKEDIYPGKVWIADNPKEDIAPVQLGEVYSSSLEAENWTWAMAGRATGVQDMQAQPNPQLGSRDTYRGQALRSSKSMGIFGSIASAMEESWSRVAMLVVFNLIKNREKVVANERVAQRLTEEEISRLETRMLAVDVSEIPRRFRFSTRTTDLDLTYEALKQSVMTVLGLQTQYMQTTMPLVMQLFTPQGMMMQQAAPELHAYMLKMFTGITRLTESAFKFFNVEDTENYLPDVSKYERAMEMMELMRQAMGGMNGRLVGSGAGSGAEGPAGLQGLAGAGPQLSAPTGTDGGGFGGGAGGGAANPGGGQ